MPNKLGMTGKEYEASLDRLIALAKKTPPIDDKYGRVPVDATTC